MNTEAIESWVATWIARALEVEENDINTSESFTGLGLDSLSLYTLTGDISAWMGRDLPVTIAWEYPTVKGLALHLGSLPKESDESIPHVSRDQPLPLSFSQERMWNHAQKPRDRDFVVRRYILTGEVDRRALERAVDDFVRRHEILRTTFAGVNGESCQVIQSPAAGNLLYTDLSDHSAAADQAAALIQELADRGIDLANGSLFYAWLLKHHETEHSLAFVLHHMTYDARSFDVLHEEISALYNAYRSGSESPLPELRVQVADFAAWQREWLREGGEAYGAAVEWWKKHWPAGVATLNELPFSCKAKPDNPDAIHPYYTVTFSPELLERLRALCRRENVTLYTVMFAAFARLLHEYSQREQLVIGTYVSQRSKPSTAAMMGFFVNLLSLCIDHRGQPSFRELMRRIQQTMQEATIHQYLPFERLSDELEKSEDRKPPAAEIIFQLTKTTKALQLDGLTNYLAPTSRQFSKPWRLSLTVVEGENSLQASAGFDPELYAREGVIEMVQRYAAFLEANV